MADASSTSAVKNTGIQAYGGQRASEVLGLSRAPADKHEYGSLALTLELVGSLEEAVDHIHQYGSGHTESIVTGEKFCVLKDSRFHCFPFFAKQQNLCFVTL